MNYPYAPRLDSMVVVGNGTFDPLLGITSFLLPIEFVEDTFDTLILGNAFGGAAGGEIPILNTSTSTTLYVVGQYTAGQCLAGKSFDWTVELSRPFRRDQEGKAIIDDRLQVETVVADYHNTGALNIVASMENRADRTRTLDLPSGTLLQEAGELRTFLNGDTRSCVWKLTSDSAKPVTVPAVTFEVGVSKRTRH